MSTLESPCGGRGSTSVEVTVITWARKPTDPVEDTEAAWETRDKCWVSTRRLCSRDGEPGKRPSWYEVRGLPFNTPAKARRPSWGWGKARAVAQRLQGAHSPWQRPTLARWRAERCPLHPSPFHGAPPERQAPLQRKEFPRQKRPHLPKRACLKPSN